MSERRQSRDGVRATQECLERYEPNDEMRRAALGAKAAANLPPLYETLKPMAVVIASPLLAQFAANVAPCVEIKQCVGCTR